MASLLRGLVRGFVGTARSGVGTRALAKSVLSPRNLLARSRGYTRLGSSALRKPVFRNSNLLAKSIGYPARGAYLGYKGLRGIQNRGRNFFKYNRIGGRIKRGAQSTGNFIRRGAKSVYRKISADPASAALGIYQSTRTPTLELKLAGANLGTLSNPTPQENIFNTRSFSSWN